MSNDDKSRSSNSPGEQLEAPSLDNERQRLEEDERWHLVSRIVQSRAFAKSPRLREFLEFTAARTLSGHAKDLTEVEIGRKIFGRGEAFAPLDDSVVRGSARQLRAKLKEYFEVEGIGEPWQLEIPKGGYVPVFVRREAAHEPAPSAPAPVLVSSASPPRRRWVQWALLAAAALNIVFLSLNLWWARNQQSAAAPRPQPALLNAFVPPNSAPTQVVVSDFSLVLMYPLGGSERMTLDDYSKSDYLPFQTAVQSDSRLRRVFEILRTHRLTRLGDLNVVSGIQKALGGSSPVVVRHARDASSRDFKAGRHILLGNPFCTPWIDLFQDRLNFPDVRLEDSVGFRNLSPKPGEPAAFMVTADEARREEGKGYARLAHVPNLLGNEGVLLLSGVNMVTMEAAGEFAADPEAFPELMRALGAGPHDKLPYFEAILETHAVDNTPRKSRLRTVRLIGPAPAR